MKMAAMYMNRREQDDNADNADDKNYAAEDKVQLMMTNMMVNIIAIKVQELLIYHEDKRDDDISDDNDDGDHLTSRSPFCSLLRHSIHTRPPSTYINETPLLDLFQRERRTLVSQA